ncbi:hypothetical protein PT2222_100218 [Paraburkholderia tropica]
MGRLAALAVQQRLILVDALVDLFEREMRGFAFDGACGRRDGRRRADQQIGDQHAERILGRALDVFLEQLLGHVLEQHALAGERELARTVEVVRGRLRDESARLADHHVRTGGDLAARVGGRLGVGQLDRLHDLTVERVGGGRSGRAALHLRGEARKRTRGRARRGGRCRGRAGGRRAAVCRAGGALTRGGRAGVVRA